jgi:tRNA-2-methylthio-N6-dimethylallyladenosine synthase
MPKNVFIRTFGCQMNVRDSEVVKGLLAADGYKLVDDVKDADVVLFNTCSVRDHAEQRVWSGVGLLSRKKHRPLIGIIGCMAQNYQEGIRKKAPAVDIVVGPSEIDNIALYLEEALRTKASVLAVKEKPRKDAIYHTGFYEEKDHAYVVISEGCDNYCSYCVVPYVRGRLRHRGPEDIYKEVEAAVAAGIRNITLLGQNVNSYKSQDAGHKTQVDFVILLKHVSELEGLKSLSFVTSHPKDTKRDLFELMARQPVIKCYLHLPVQSGSDRILSGMNRGYTAAHYRAIIEDYRSLVYNGLVSTDVIVGFPGETDADFEATRTLMQEVRFDSAYIFKYSPRPHTAALNLKDDVPDKIKKERHAVLLELQRKISKENKSGPR